MFTTEIIFFVIYCFSTLQLTFAYHTLLPNIPTTCALNRANFFFKRSSYNQTRLINKIKETEKLTQQYLAKGHHPVTRLLHLYGSSCVMGAVPPPACPAELASPRPGCLMLLGDFLNKLKGKYCSLTRFSTDV